MIVNKITSAIGTFWGRIGPRALRSIAAALLAVSFVGAPIGMASAEEFNGKPINYATPSALASKKLLLDVARAGDRIVAVGEFGNIIYSDDDGATWVQANSVQTQVTLTSVSFPSKDLGFAVGHDAVVLKTVDGGENWTIIYEDFDAESPLLSVIFESTSHGIAMGAFGYLIETDDGGDSWHKQAVIPGGDDDFHLNDSFEAKDGGIWIAAEFGIVYHSADDGATFTRIKTPYDGSFWGGLGLSDGSLLIYGMRGNVFRSADNGVTWEKIDTGVTKSFGGSVELANGAVVLVGLNGAVAYSTDLGKSFVTVSRIDREGYNAVIGLKDGEIAIFGQSGVKVMPDSAEAAIASGAASAGDGLESL